MTFLHTTVKVAHGNLCEHVIYVTPSGDFKLSSLQLLTSVGINDGATGPTPHFRHFERDVTPLEYRSPERIEGRWDAISTSPIHAMGAYSMGVFITNLYAHDGAGTYGLYVFGIHLDYRRNNRQVNTCHYLDLVQINRVLMAFPSS